MEPSSPLSLSDPLGMVCFAAVRTYRSQAWVPFLQGAVEHDVYMFAQTRLTCDSPDHSIIDCPPAPFSAVTQLSVNSCSTITCYPYSEPMKPRMQGEQSHGLGHRTCVVFCCAPLG